MDKSSEEGRRAHAQAEAMLGVNKGTDAFPSMVIVFGNEGLHIAADFKPNDSQHAGQLARLANDATIRFLGGDPSGDAWKSSTEKAMRAAMEFSHRGEVLLAMLVMQFAGKMDREEALKRVLSAADAFRSEHFPAFMPPDNDAARWFHDLNRQASEMTADKAVEGIIKGMKEDNE